MDNLDGKDRKLLSALKANSRASLVSLGRDIGLSRSATHDRITRLEEIGVIKGYTIKIAENVQGKTKAFISVRFKPEYASNIATKNIFDMEGVEATYCLSGDIDTLVYCECESMRELSELRDIIAKMPGISDIHIRNILTTHGIG